MVQTDDKIKSFQIDPALFYEAIINSTDNYIYVIDMQRDVALLSPNMQQDFALPGRVVPGLVPLWGERIHEKDKVRYFQSIDQMLEGHTTEHNVEYQVRNAKGEYIWVLCRGLLQRNEAGEPVMFAGVVTDLGSKGKIDYITGLFTYRECEKEIGVLLEKKSTTACGVMLLGLDDFVRINDLNDHVFGDSVLRQFAQNVQQLLPADVSMYRFDGDEFAIVYPEVTEWQMEKLYQKIHVYCNRVHQLDGTSYFCTVSAGIAMLGRESGNYQELIKCAASALEVSKQRGKNIFTFFTPDLMQTKLRALAVSNQMQLDVMNRMAHFNLVYQPFVHADGLGLAGAEALLRWACPPFGAVSPMEFIPLLESSGLIVPVGKWVLEQAVKTCKKWMAWQPDFVMNVNISYLQMLDESFVPFVEKVLQQYKLEPQHVVLELTESYFVTDMGALKESFRRLRDLNIQIAMDDFGTGYSSLGMLSQSPADIVKIDRLFISAIHDHKNTFNHSFIGSVIQLCHSVGITVCVEGVEQPAELDAVCSLQADRVQGFYLSKPLPPAGFETKYWPVAIEE